MYLFAGWLVIICIGYLIAMNIIGATSKVAKGLVVITFAVSAFALTYRVLDYFNYMSAWTWMLLWLEIPVYLVEFWFIKDWAEKLASIPPRGPRFDKVVQRMTKPPKATSKWVKTAA